MTTIKTSDLTGAALDWAVAKCEKLPVTSKHYDLRFIDEYSFSTDWALAGPIMERMEICIAKVGRTSDDAIAPHPDCWCAHIDGVFARYASTPLIAAMRCHVAAKLGDTVQVPAELSA